MSKPSVLIVCVAGFFLSSCSPRDFLTRRLAGDLIAASDTFRASQRFQLRTGVISNQDYLSRTISFCSIAVGSPARMRPVPLLSFRRRAGMFRLRPQALTLFKA